MVPRGTPIVNALFRQRACIENIFRACIGLSPQNYMLLEHKLAAPQQLAAGVKTAEKVGEKSSLSAASSGARVPQLGRARGTVQAIES